MNRARPATSLLRRPDEGAAWQKIRPKTLVAQAADTILAGIARGAVLPGDRITEAELAAALGMSRVPVREALRALEQQGVVVSEPYKGMTLAPLTQVRVEQVTEVRVALETTAARTALALGRNTAAAVAPLEHAIAELELAAVRRDGYGLGRADAAFHHAFCRLGGNDVLCGIWQSIAVQVTIAVGLSTLVKPMGNIVEEHRILLKAFLEGDPAKLERAIEEHVRLQNDAVDFEALIARRRAINARQEQRWSTG